MTARKEAPAVSGEPDADIQRLRIQGKLAQVDVVRIELADEGYEWQVESVATAEMEGRRVVERRATFPEARDRARELVADLDKAIGAIHRGRQALQKAADSARSQLDEHFSARASTE